MTKRDALSSEWRTCSDVQHKGIIKAEANCACGTTERHQHCAECRRLYSIGNWDAPSIPVSAKLRCKLNKLGREVSRRMKP